MAITQVPESTSFSIEVQNSTDKAGDPIYGKKNFSNLKNDATPQDVYDVAEAIKAVLEASTRETFLNKSGKLINN